MYAPALWGGTAPYDTGTAPRLAPPTPVAAAEHGVWSVPLNTRVAGQVMTTAGVAGEMVIVAVAIAAANWLLPPPHVTVSVYVPTFTGTAPPLYVSAGVRPLVQEPLPGCGKPSKTAVAPDAPTVVDVDAIARPVALKLNEDGSNVTPGGASPPTLGVATTVFVPGVLPRK